MENESQEGPFSTRDEVLKLSTRILVGLLVFWVIGAASAACPGDRTVGAGTTWDFDTPTVSDLCGGGGTIQVLSTTTNALFEENPGPPTLQDSYLVTRIWQITDYCANTFTCTQRVAVVTSSLPFFLCPEDEVVYAGTGLNFTEPKVFSHCGFTNTVPFVLVTTTNSFCRTSYSVTRTWAATDSCGHSNTCSQVITVLVTNPPPVICSGDRVVELGQSWNFDPPVVNDAAGGTNVEVRILGTTTNGTCGKTFVATRTWSVTDACGNSNVCSQVVSVVDTTPPVISCASNQVVEYGTAWDFTAPTATDIADGVDLTFAVIGTITNGACGKTFVATRTWSVTDACGNSNVCSQVVSVVDTTPPVITCASNQVVEYGTAWDFTAPTATDVADGEDLAFAVIGTMTNGTCGKTFVATRTWSVTDACGNSNVCSQVVSVVDTTPPAITCASDQVVECGDFWTFTPPTAIDIADGETLAIQIAGTETNFVTATTFTATRTWTVTDSCSNTATCTQAFKVVDTVPPAISCPADIVAGESPVGSGGAIITFDLPAATDVCSSPAVTTVPPSGAVFPIGETMVVATAIDGSGNTNTCTFTVRVVPNTIRVVSTGDSGPGTLRAALGEANLLPDTNVLAFALPGVGPHQITLQSALPAVVFPAAVDGSTQGGSDPQAIALLTAEAAGIYPGLVLESSNSVVRGLSLKGFVEALRLGGGGGHVIQGNAIVGGMNPNGTPNSGSGIVITSPRNLVGGDTPELRNVIAGRMGHGVLLTGTAAAGNLVVGNLVVSNGLNGISLDNSAGAGNGILGNSIYANGGLGIDLGSDGVTPNDGDAADTGPNHYQDYPVLHGIRFSGGVSIVEGVLQSASNRTYRVEFFLNEKTDESQYGEGQTFLGFVSVTISNNLPAPFAFALPGLVETNRLITATATDSSFNTSEFSRGVADLLGPPVVDDNPGATNVVPGQDVTLCATASGTPPIRYQWRLNGVNIPGETNRCLTISSVQYSDGGTYTVLAENPLGAASSLAARLLVQAPILRGGDNFADRTRVTGTKLIYLSDNKGATREEGEPLHAGKPGGKSVWYTWKAPLTGVATVETRGSVFDTLLGIYSGSTLANLLSRASDEDRGGFYTSRTRFNAIKNREYHFAVDGFGAAEGDFNLGLDVQDTPHLLPGFHTQPSSQTVAPGSAVTFSSIATRYCGNGHENCPNPNDYPKDELPTMAYQWLFYGIAIPGATTTSLTITNVQPENLGLYSMSVTTGWQTNESDAANLQINVTGDAVQNVQAADKLLDSQGGTPLFVGAVEAAQGAIPGEPGTSAAGAVVSGYTGSQVFNTAGSATGPSEIICGVVGGASQWITYVALQSGTLFLNTDGSSYDTVMAVFRRSPANPAILEQLGCDNNSGPGGKTSVVTVPVAAGQTNYVLVDGVNGVSGTLQFNYSLATPVTLSALEPALGKARLRVNSRPNLRFSIQATTNMVDWETLTTTNSAEAVLDYVDPSPLYERRFYRAVVLP